jgi:hypothetical protein
MTGTFQTTYTAPNGIVGTGGQEPMIFAEVFA